MSSVIPTTKVEGSKMIDILIQTFPATDACAKGDFIPPKVTIGAKLRLVPYMPR